MTMKEIKEKAKEVGVSIGKANKTDAVRMIQTAEGNQPCFATGIMQSCGQMECLFRTDCN